jgi:hypothetical protein
MDEQEENVIDINEIIRAQNANADIRTVIGFFESTRNKSNRLKRTHVASIYADAMLGGELGKHYLPDLEYQPFVILADSIGQKHVCEVKPGDVLVRKDKQWLRSTVSWASAKACKSFTNVSKIADFHLAARDIDSVVSTILDICPYIKETAIPAFRFRDDPGYCFSRLDFIPAAGEHPTFDAIGSYLEDPVMYDTLKWFIGELFNTGELEQKMLWIYGDGGNGKGTIIRMLSSVFKSAAISIGTDKQDLDKFWSAALIGKRVAIGTDVENIYVIDHPAVKAISGNDPVPVRDMNSRQRSEFIPCQFIFTSNYKPHFKGKTHQERRLLYVGFRKGKPDFIDNFREKITEETPHFLHACISFWERCRDTGVIPQAASALDDLALEGTEDIHGILDSMWQGKPRYVFGGEQLKMDCSVLWQHVQPKNHFAKSDIIRVLEKDYGVRKIRWKCPIRKRAVWVFSGMADNI